MRDGKGMQNVWWREDVYTGFWWRNLRERDHVKDLGIGGRIILPGSG